MSSEKKTFLILADKSEEFQTAVHYASLAARQNGAGIMVLRVLTKPDFQHWGTVEERMRQEQMQEAQALLEDVKKRIVGLSGIEPKIVIEVGQKAETVVKVIEREPSITKLILAASINPSGPGPLIEHFAGKGMDELNITLTIVPGHLSSDQIEKLL